MERCRYLISGSGGQGVITLAIIFAEAASIYDGREAVQSQSYGPEARGGATRSDVIISDSEIFFPKVLQPNVLVALTAESATKYLPLIRPGGICLYDVDFVNPSKKTDATLKGIAMFDAVKKTFGRTQAYNICVLGVLATLTNGVRIESLEKVLAQRFAPAFQEANKKALYLGQELALPFVDA